MKRNKVIFILGGGIIEVDGKWRTTTFFEDGDMFGALGDRLRVEAASLIHKQNNEEVLLIPSGSKGQLKDHETAPTIASVISSELLLEGVPAEALLLDELSDNTYQQLCTLARFIEEFNWSDVSILTNLWHLPRVKTMIKVTDNLGATFTRRQVKFLAAEEILLEIESDKWGLVIKEAYDSEGMRLRKEKEDKGIDDLLSGKYILK